MHERQIGNVVRVESGRVEIACSAAQSDLEVEGESYRVGQLGSYVTLPRPARTVVGFVTGSTLESGAMADEGEDGQIRISAQLIGEIRGDRFVRGVADYPVTGDPVCMAIHDDFEVIFGSQEEVVAADGHRKAFTLGRFANNTDFEVRILGTEFLAKHVAVLGNSGSGKSCTTGRILQELTSFGSSQVVMFDMHGEYRSAFTNEEGMLREDVTYLGVDDLVLPFWLLKYDELEDLFVDRSNPETTSTQISFLRTALLEFKQDAAEELGLVKALTLDTPIAFSLEQLKNYAENLNEARYVLNDDHLAFSQLAMRSLPVDEQQKLMRTQRCTFNRGNPEGETPHPLYFGKLLGLIDQIDTKFNDRRYEFMLRPLLHSKNSGMFSEMCREGDTAGQISNVMNHLIRLLTGRGTSATRLTIVDLSGIPFEIVDITVAVLTRLLFDLNFWTPASQRHPTLLVFEEAHNYIPRVSTGRHFARVAVERVAKEGRKYGVSAMVISQRPAELSETVLAQCNNLVVMRLSNPEDQHYVSRVVSDHFTSLIQMLPVLRPGEAFVIGDSVLMPMRTLVTLPEPTPLSANCDFFKAWSREMPDSDIDEIIEHWRRQDRQMLNRIDEARRSAASRNVEVPAPTGTPDRPAPSGLTAPSASQPVTPPRKPKPSSPWLVVQDP
jgi:DNA helicase HerA-like ATPase